MSKYLFACDKCNKTEEREIPMADYSEQKEKQVCSCGDKMYRVFEPIGLTVYNCKGFYDTDKRGVGGR